MKSISKLSKQKLWPGSLRWRLVVVLLLGVLLAQVISSVVWITQARRAEEASVTNMANHMAYGVASTVKFFQSLPHQYRHIVLDQLRNMGGTRFFVSVNQAQILVDDLADSYLHDIVIDQFYTILRKELGSKPKIIVQFAESEKLKVFNNNTYLTDLPPRWAHHSLLIKPLSPPILVTQIKLAEKEWLYVAALIPHPTFLAKTEFISFERVLFLGLTMVCVLLISFFAVRWLTEPLARLSKAADDLGRDLDHPPLAEKGSKEMIATARTFNAMQQRLKRYIDDRARLFAAISHDLKTPITRLRLRAEMLEEEVSREKFVTDLEELEIMVKGALQCAKDTELDEPQSPTNLMDIINKLKRDVEEAGHSINIYGKIKKPYMGKPLALKRCLTNLIDNAIFYGERAELNLEDGVDEIKIIIRDYGPGISEKELDQVFEPYYRIEKSRNRNTGGTGLGLGIARSIVKAHGGELILDNHPECGLIVRVVLPRH
ncbi:HAMP domain-containing protein [Endozoicomonas sp. SM1973]|uniref:histidine kinase n=1 Tax=Spartinivicinus marinus TaxID=2994442 RepID=A0A853IHG8_9GAMM|nr:ATP-binding protein [Spartinivicinus marinus]MCX4027501.1 ATP-binding protein [Spartinivicinus marinus]NYZ68877.1 HAMP domain-containing protein [Spartinivicinus marinus]